ncbi:hypothetical protein BC829DRAFT_395513 [Chytridium lagenaria]|nr:hypothetical protein BC829DRAFT_395513 [Chytridium lagenaria]
MCVYFQKEAMVCIDDASAEGRLDIITLLHRGMKGRDVSPWGSIMDKASERGHLRIVRFLHIEGGTCTTFAMDKAAENGHLDVVKFLYENRQEGCTPIAMWTALSRGHVGVVKFLCEAKGMDVCIGDEDVAVAAQRGYVDLVEFLTQLIVKRRTILASESITMDCAAEKGHV